MATAGGNAAGAAAVGAVVWEAVSATAHLAARVGHRPAAIHAARPRDGGVGHHVTGATATVAAHRGNRPAPRVYAVVDDVRVGVVRRRDLRAGFSTVLQAVVHV